MIDRKINISILNIEKIQIKRITQLNSSFQKWIQFQRLCERFQTKQTFHNVT